MKKILLINAWEEFDKGMEHISLGGDQFPLDHFWCYDTFKNTEHYQIMLLKYNNKTFLNKLGTLFKIENLQQQIDCVRKQREYDAVFVPFMEHTLFLAILKSLDLYNKPIFAIAQKSYSIKKENVLKRILEYSSRYFYFKGVDSILFLNKKLFDENGKYSLRPNVDYAKHWGMDFDFFQTYHNAQTQLPTLDYIFATGGSARDFNTLINAFSGVDFHLKIIPKKNMGYPAGCKVIPNVMINNSLPNGLLSTGALRKEYYNALAVAIPLVKTRWVAPHGVTVLLEAMAMGKPVITTKNKAYPIDVEKEKVGFNMDYGDVKGWQEAINYLMNHSDEAREMGERGRCLCKKRFNYALFSEEVIEKFSRTIM